MGNGYFLDRFPILKILQTLCEIFWCQWRRICGRIVKTVIDISREIICGKFGRKEVLELFLDVGKKISAELSELHSTCPATVEWLVKQFDYLKTFSISCKIRIWGKIFRTCGETFPAGLWKLSSMSPEDFFRKHFSKMFILKKSDNEKKFPAGLSKFCSTCPEEHFEDSLKNFVLLNAHRTKNRRKIFGLLT